MSSAEPGGGRPEPLVEGRDYRFPDVPRPNYWDHRYAGPDITILTGGPAKLKERDRLAADWYQPVVGASVHIADGIDPHTVGKPRFDRLTKVSG